MLGIKIKDLKIYIDGSETTTNFKTESFGFQDFHCIIPDFESAQSKNLTISESEECTVDCYSKFQKYVLTS